MAGNGSARVTLKEIDLSQVQKIDQQPQGVPAAVVGTARKGPAFVPRVFANMQQFEKVFGSMNEKGILTNSNLHAPLAFNEWMKNANAGMFTRILGIGDGKQSVKGEVNEAGFEVGQELVQKTSSGGLSVVSKNVYAQITDLEANRTLASDVAKTHFLGCFMKDAEGSSFLAESGMSSPLSNAFIKITMNAQPLDGSTITLTDSDGISKTFEFDSGDGAAAENVNVTIGGNAAATLVNLNDAINQQVNFDISSQINADGVLIITQGTTGLNGHTSVESRINASERDQITITSANDQTISNSTTADFIKLKGGGGTELATATITPHDVDGAFAGIADGNTLKLKALKEDSTLTNEVTITFSDILENAFSTDNATSFNVKTTALNTEESVKETLVNLAAGINGLNGSEIEGLLNAEVKADGSLIISQRYPGVLDGTDVAANNDLIKFTIATDSVEINGTTSDNTELTETFEGGVAGNSSIVLEVSDFPAIGDSFTLINKNGNNSEQFLFVADSNGSKNGVILGTIMQVELAETLEQVVGNIQTAILSVASPVKNDFTVEQDGKTLIITQVLAGLAGDTNFTLDTSSAIKAISRDEELVGNFGLKTIDFSGGGSGATPVIRGILMCPQGVKPSLEMTGYNTTEPTSPLEVSGVTFNDVDNPANLFGYELGDVDSNNKFTLYLNGFSNSEEQVKLDCSFDPSSASYFANVLNTDPEKIEEKGHYLYTWYDIETSVAEISNEGLLASGAPVNGDKSKAFIISGSESNPELHPDYENFKSRFSTAKTPWIVSQKFGEDNIRLFRLHSLDDGEVSNKQYRLLISNLRYVSLSEYGLFDLTLEKLDSNPISGEALVSWKNLSLDRSSSRFIGRVIGTKHTYFNFETNESNQRILENGDLPLKNDFVRIELSNDLLRGEVPVDALPSGFESHMYANTAITGNFNLSAPLFLTDSDGSAIDYFANAKVSPLPFVKSICRLSGADEVALSDLAWGVKFAKKQNSESSLKETVEEKFNPAIMNYAKFLPSIGDAKFGDDSNTNFQNGLFSLEKIQLGNGDAWDGSEYRRDGVLKAGKGRFVKISQDASVGTSVKFLKFRCMFQGGFDGVNIFDKEKSRLSNVATLREYFDETGKGKRTGPTVVAYQKAVDVLSDGSSFDFQLLAIPGQRANVITDYALDMCENKFDCLFIMDIVEKDALGRLIEDDSIRPSVSSTVSEFESRNIDSSFGAAYFPDVTLRRPSDNVSIVAPPSVAILGVYSRNDRIAQPWFAPAGINRGLLLSSSRIKLDMTRDQLDLLYDNDINPIYIPSGRNGQVVAFGQKTLLQLDSTLDRVNVRRLLINLRRRIKDISNRIVFEQNNAATLNRVKTLIEAIMQDAQNKQGVARYKVQFDETTTTQLDIEMNTIRGKVYLQPINSVEFISLDFQIKNSL